MTLRTAGHVDRALHLEESPFVVQRTDSRGVEESPAGFVCDDGTVFPAVPQPLHDVDELLGDLVAEVVLHVLFAAEVQRGLAGRAGHDVPGGAALAQVVNRGEGPGHVIGLAEARRDGGAQANALGGGSQRRDERRRLEAAQKRWVISGIHDQSVRDEQEVELAALGLTGDLLDDRKVIVAGRGPLISPAGGVVAGAKDEHAEMHLTPRSTHAGCSPGDNLPQAWYCGAARLNAGGRSCRFSPS